MNLLVLKVAPIRCTILLFCPAQQLHELPRKNRCADDRLETLFLHALNKLEG
jgi:hypothetical protein